MPKKTSFWHWKIPIISKSMKYNVNSLFIIENPLKVSLWRKILSQTMRNDLNSVILNYSLELSPLLKKIHINSSPTKNVLKITSIQGKSHSLTSFCSPLQLEAPRSRYRFDSAVFSFVQVLINEKVHKQCIFTDFWLYEWGIPGWGMLNVKNEAVIWRAACCVLMCEQTPPGAAVHCEITAWTGSGDLNSNNTHTELPYYGTAGTPADCLMIPHPPRIEVTETLIQDSLIIASVSFYLHLLKHYLCACFILHFHPYLYPSLSCKASPDTLLTFKAKISL